MVVLYVKDKKKKIFPLEFKGYTLSDAIKNVESKGLEFSFQSRKVCNKCQSTYYPDKIETINMCAKCCEINKNETI